MSVQRADRIASRPGAPVPKLLFVEALGVRGCDPPGIGPLHRARVELATIDTHRAVEAAAISNVDWMMVIARGGIGSKYVAFPGRGDHSVPRILLGCSSRLS
jgi:hypothetical protein